MSVGPSEKDHVRASPVLLTLEVYRLDLILETCAHVQCALEVGLAQGKDLDLLAGGSAGGIAPLVGHKRALAEEMSRGQGRNEFFLPARPALEHVDGAMTDQKELIAWIPLTDDDLVVLVTSAFHFFRDIRDLGRREMLEKVHVAQKLAD